MNDIEIVALITAVLNGVGYAIKKSPVQNWVIPWILMIAGGVFYVGLHPGFAWSNWQDIVLDFVRGVICGITAVGVHGIYKNHTENGDGNTTVIIKPPENKP